MQQGARRVEVLEKAERGVLQRKRGVNIVGRGTGGPRGTVTQDARGLQETRMGL